MDRTTHTLVLREVNYKETDKILTILTPEWGKMTVSARGCRKKGSRLAAGTQLLVYGEMTLYEFRGRWAVREAEPEQLFWGVRQDVEKLALASYFAELMELLSQEEVPAPELLSLILNSLYALDTLQKPQDQVKSTFELKLMSLAGYEPMLEGCGVCGEEPTEPMLHLREGTLHCRKCREKLGDGVSMPLTQGAVAGMRHVVLGNPKRLFSFRLGELDQKRMNDTCEAFVLTQLERGFSTLDFYKMLTQGSDRSAIG
jgi:DNA repair protein RecO (recombination protein O)